MYFLWLSIQIGILVFLIQSRAQYRFLALKDIHTSSAEHQVTN